MPPPGAARGEGSTAGAKLSGSSPASGHGATRKVQAGELRAEGQARSPTRGCCSAPRGAPPDLPQDPRAVTHSRDSCCKPPAWRWGPSPDWANNCCPPRGPTPGAPAPLPRPSVHPCTHPGDAVALEHPGPVLTSGAAEGSHAVAHSADGFCKQGQRQLDAAATQAQATPPPPRPSHTKLGFVQSSDPLKLFRG